MTLLPADVPDDEAAAAAVEAAEPEAEADEAADEVDVTSDEAAADEEAAATVDDASDAADADELEMSYAAFRVPVPAGRRVRARRRVSGGRGCKAGGDGTHPTGSWCRRSSSSW